MQASKREREREWGGAMCPGVLTTPHALLKKSERERERERVSSHFGSSTAPFAWGTVAPPGIGGRDAELARGCTPWESCRCFSQQCLSHTPAASVLKWPLLLGSLAPPLQCANTVKFAPFELHATVGDLGAQRSPGSVVFSFVRGVQRDTTPTSPRRRPSNHHRSLENG